MSVASSPFEHYEPLEIPPPPAPTSSANTQKQLAQLHRRQRYPLNTFGNHLRFIFDQLRHPVGVTACALSFGLGILGIPFAAGGICLVAHLGRKHSVLSIPAVRTRLAEGRASSLLIWKVKDDRLTFWTNISAITLSALVGMYASYRYHGCEPLSILANPSVFGPPVNAVAHWMVPETKDSPLFTPMR